MRNRYVLLADAVLIGVAAFVAFALRFDLRFLNHQPAFNWFLAAALIIKPSVFLGFGLYRRFWRYASLNDMLVVAVAVSAACAGLAVVIGVGVTYAWIPWFSRAVLLTDWLLTLFAVVGIRLSVRVVGESLTRSRERSTASPRKRVLIVGAGEAGTMFAREMFRNPQLGLSPVGFVDDAPEKIGKRIQGVPVIADTEGLSDAIIRANADQVIIAMPKASGPRVRALAEACRNAGVHSRTMPGVFEILDGIVSVSRLRDVEIADLLRREQVTSEGDASAYLERRDVVVTGAGGSIGSELCRQIAHARPRSLTLLGHGENSSFEAHAQLIEAFPHVKVAAVIVDIRDRERLLRVFESLRPEIVFHAAAHKHVPLMEQNPEEAITNNVFGTKNVVDAALASGAERLVLISTDKAVSPSSIMGASKRIAELIVRQAARDHRRAYSVVRFGNVLGSRGSVVPFFKRQIERGGPVTVTHPEMRRFFMTIPEAVHLVLQAGGLGAGGELFVLKMGEAVRIVDLARDLIELSGFDPQEIPIVFTGMRPGEKLEEALWEADARIEPSRHPEVLRVVEPEPPGTPPLQDLLAALTRALQDGGSPAIEAAVVQTVSRFQPNWLRRAAETASQPG
jgi:FlaA1/EpsC-like NDP-sugar epimerase